MKLKQFLDKDLNEANDQGWLEVARDVLDKKQYVYINPKNNAMSDDKKKGFIILDLQTANMLVTIADALKDVNKQKFTSMPLIQSVNLGWKLLGKFGK